MRKMFLTERLHMGPQQYFNLYFICATWAGLCSICTNEKTLVKKTTGSLDFLCRCEKTF